MGSFVSQLLMTAFMVVFGVSFLRFLVYGILIFGGAIFVVIVWMLWKIWSTVKGVFA